MRLYAGPSTLFIQDTKNHQIRLKLRKAFYEYNGYNPSPGEETAWQNSLLDIAGVVDDAGLHDHGVIVEYELPFTSYRIDFLLTGKSKESGRSHAVLVELKQWSECEETDADELMVETFVGKKNRVVLHPAAQANRYQRYLLDQHEAFHEVADPIQLASCAYLHNYHPRKDDPLFRPRYQPVLADTPVFTADHVEDLSGFLRRDLTGGDGLTVLARVEENRFRASKKLLDHVGSLIKAKPEYVLLDEQQVIYQTVLERALKARGKHTKLAIIVHGGPGTGKSVLAMCLLGELSIRGLNAHYVTGSKAFTQTLRKIVGARAGQQFKYFNSYMHTEQDVIDVMIADESHRIRENSANMWMKKSERPTEPQIHELLNACRVAVFFIDDNQVVRAGEIGSSAYIRQEAEKLGVAIEEFALEAQFRCSGAAGYILWVSHTLRIQDTANKLLNKQDNFEFRVCGSVEALDEAVRAKVVAGHTARLTAGYCWDWSTKTKPDGTLVDDVVIGDFKRPWNAREGLVSPRDAPPAELWAYDDRGIGQVGCIYTAQGFEFDYVGVIWGKDLCYDMTTQKWIGDRKASKDSAVKKEKDDERFLAMVKNTYRVLLTRGMKGCYVYFMDKETEKFIRSRVDYPLSID